MPYLLDTNAISEIFKPIPNQEFVDWLETLPRAEQFTSSVVIGELFVVAFRSPARGKWLRRIAQQVLPRLTILSFDLECAEHYGQISAFLLSAGTPIGDNDVQIAATAQRYGLCVVTANVRHFERVPALEIKSFTTGAAR